MFRSDLIIEVSDSFPVLRYVSLRHAAKTCEDVIPHDATQNHSRMGLAREAEAYLPKDLHSEEYIVFQLFLIADFSQPGGCRKQQVHIVSPGKVKTGTHI